MESVAGLSWKIKCHRMEVARLTAEVQNLQGNADCYRLAKQIYEELIKLDAKLAWREELLKEKERA